MLSLLFVPGTIIDVIIPESKSAVTSCTYPKPSSDLLYLLLLYAWNLTPLFPYKISPYAIICTGAWVLLNIFPIFANIWLTFLYILYIILFKVSKAGCGVSFPNERRAMRMLEQIYIFFIYILLFELAFMIVLVVALFVALVFTSRKLDNKKSTSLLDR